MFMITGGSGSNATLTDESPQPNNAVGIYVEQPNHRTNTQPFQAVHDLKKGPIDHLHALDDLLDCCIIYYYGVAHKYVIMVTVFFFNNYPTKSIFFKLDCRTSR